MKEREKPTVAEQTANLIFRESKVSNINHRPGICIYPLKGKKDSFTPARRLIPPPILRFALF
jgi:hypothetical protein